MSYILLTKFWNEREKIPRLVRCVQRQEMQPIIWLLLDDGSKDGSLAIFLREAELAGIRTLSISMPPKTEGDINTLGRAYQRAFDHHLPRLEMALPEFLAMLDVDTYPPPLYFADMVSVLDRYPRIGAVSGQIEGDMKRTSMPMGSGKVVRWPIARKTAMDGFWDLDADSLLNIKAVNMGYWLAIVDDYLIPGEKSTLFTPRGQFRMGRRGYYCGRPLPLVILKMAMVFPHQPRHALEYMGGYLTEYARGEWRCEDPDVLDYYSARYSLIGFRRLKKLRRDML